MYKHTYARARARARAHTHTHKVREVDEKAQGASNEAKLLSCAAVLKAGVQTAELKHKTLSVKGAPHLRRAERGCDL